MLKRELKTGDSLKFPMSPSFVHNFNTAKEVNLKQVTAYCLEKNIPFSSEEDKFYKLKQAKNNFTKFKRAVDACYETSRPQIE